MDGLASSSHRSGPEAGEKSLCVAGNARKMIGQGDAMFCVSLGEFDLSEGAVNSRKTELVLRIGWLARKRSGGWVECLIVPASREKDVGQCAQCSSVEREQPQTATDRQFSAAEIPMGKQCMSQFSIAAWKTRVDRNTAPEDRFACGNPLRLPSENEPEVTSSLPSLCQ